MNNIISDKASMLEALEMLNSLPGSAMTLFITDDTGRLIGTLTDGDIRRSLLRGLPLDAPVAEAAHRDFKALRAGDSDEVVRFVLRFMRTYRELTPDRQKVMQDFIATLTNQK